LKMGPTGFPETSVTSYHSTLLKIPEERRYHLYRGGSLKLRKAKCCPVLNKRSVWVTYSKYLSMGLRWAGGCAYLKWG